MGVLLYSNSTVVLAIQSQVKITPVIIEGAKECLGYGRWRIREGVVTVRLLNAISTKGMTYEDREELVSQLTYIAEKELA